MHVGYAVFGYSFKLETHFQDIVFAEYADRMRQLQGWIESGSQAVPSIITNYDLGKIVNASSFGPYFNQFPHMLRLMSETTLVAFNIRKESYHFHLSLAHPVLHLDNIFWIHKVRQVGFLFEDVFRKIKMPNQVIMKDSLPHTFECTHRFNDLYKVDDTANLNLCAALIAVTCLVRQSVEGSSILIVLVCWTYA